MSCVRCLDFLWVSSGDARRVFGLLCGSVYLVECFNALRLLSLECRGPLLITASVFSPLNGTPKQCSICVQGFLKRYLKVCSFFSLGIRLGSLALDCRCFSPKVQQVVTENLSNF